MSTSRAAALAANQPCGPIRHGSFVAVPFGHLRGVRLDLRLAIPAPHDQSKVSPRRAAQSRWRSRGGFQLPASPIPASRRRLVALRRRRQRLVHLLRPDHRTDRVSPLASRPGRGALFARQLLIAVPGRRLDCRPKLWEERKLRARLKRLAFLVRRAKSPEVLPISDLLRPTRGPPACLAASRARRSTAKSSPPGSANSLSMARAAVDPA
jgi:hypothetical protein